MDDIVSSNPPQKQCNKCKLFKPLTDFHVRKSSVDGHQHRCKQCFIKPYKRPQYPPVPDGYKRCTKCKEVKQATKDNFVHASKKKYNLSSWCKTCFNARYAAKNPDVRRDYSRQHYIEHKERILQWGKQYRITHIEAIQLRKQQNKAYRAQYDRQYRALHYDRVLVHNRNRHALKKGAIGTHTPQQIQEQYTRQKGKCYYCQHKVAWGKHHVDHVVPLSREGSNDISNLVITCPTCNLKKHDKLPHEWPQGGRLL